jgi:hypothetical protein
MNKVHKPVLSRWTGWIFIISLCSFIMHFCIFNGMNTFLQQTINQVEQFEENSPSETDLEEDDLVYSRAVSPKILLTHSADEWVTMLIPHSTDSDQLTPPPESI